MAAVDAAEYPYWNAKTRSASTFFRVCTMLGLFTHFTTPAFNLFLAERCYDST